MLRRVQWGSLVAVTLVLFALGALIVKQTEAGIVLALCSITWAILSLKERP